MCLLVDVLIARKIDESCAHVPFEDSCLCFNHLVVCKKKKKGIISGIRFHFCQKCWEPFYYFTKIFPYFEFDGSSTSQKCWDSAMLL